MNNAGVFSFWGKTADGFETTFAVDYLAPFLLTNLLLELLKASAPSRVVNVSSVAHFNGHIDLAAIERKETPSGWGAYANSKLALVMFTYELARRLQGTGVTANCLHPGGVATDIWTDPACVYEAVLEEREGGGRDLDLPGVLTGSREASPANTSSDKSAKKSSEDSYDEEKARLLWDSTSKMVGLSA